jgi:hypothetical protein
VKLTQADLRNVVQHLPKDVRKQLSRNPGKLFVGGGFIRAIVAGEKPSDIDMFGDTKDRLNRVVMYLQNDRQGSKTHITGNAITLLSENRMPIQFITRWLFDTPAALVSSFDFTVCQGVVFYADGKWDSEIGDSFYNDLASRRLVYTFPVREEEAGGSMLRVLKYLRRGYHIQIDSLAGVMSRVTKATMNSIVDSRESLTVSTETTITKHTKELLREVDPLLVIDGLDVIDDHEKDEDMNNENF